MIADTIGRYASPDTVLFVTSNALEAHSTSSDVDIYCVTSDGISSVHMFYAEDGRWTELFIDTISDLRAKLQNSDEIVANFIRELPFVCGDQALYQRLLQETANLAKHYKLPEHRRNLLKYRVKVLLSKYEAAVGHNLAAQEHFILSALSYPLIQLVLEYHGVFPASPKRWLYQLRAAIPGADFDELDRFLAHSCTTEEVTRLCELYAGNIQPIHLEKKPSDNLTTFLS